MRPTNDDRAGARGKRVTKPGGGPGTGTEHRGGSEKSPSRDADDRQSSEEAEKEALDSQLDEELEDSFPASDPPSLTQEPR